MIDEATFAAFRDIGRDLFLRGLVTSHGGNLSCRTGEGICITRTKAMLGRIAPDDLVNVSLEGPHPDDGRASSELIVHRAIYRSCGAGAIVHAHPPYATLLSMLGKEIVPADSEGCYLLEKCPIVSLDRIVTVGLPESAEALSKALQDCRIVVLKGHGSFAKGDTLEDAYMLTSSLEASSFYLYHLKGR